jgi:hypothetical protein
VSLRQALESPQLPTKFWMTSKMSDLNWQLLERGNK